MPNETIDGLHYNFTPLKVCLSEMAYTTGCCSLKAQFIPLAIAFGSISNNFGFTRLEKGEIYWTETSKDWNNAAIKGMYPFVCDV